MGEGWKGGAFSGNEYKFDEFVGKAGVWTILIKEECPCP
jgi:hypothetical protein